MFNANICKTKESKLKLNCTIYGGEIYAVILMDNTSPYSFTDLLKDPTLVSHARVPI